MYIIEIVEDATVSLLLYYCYYWYCCYCLVNVIVIVIIIIQLVEDAAVSFVLSKHCALTLGEKFLLSQDRNLPFIMKVFILNYV